jgi:uncharacterized phage-associated protein
VASVFDVAQYILRKQGGMTTMKLQKLVYYAQAWSLVWDEEPLFDQPIEAWSNGPVVRELFDAHRGMFMVREGDIQRGNWHDLTHEQKATIRAVLHAYGGRSSQWLSDLTHREPPWRDARAELPDGVRGNRVITHGEMADYYGNL